MNNREGICNDKSSYPIANGTISLRKDHILWFDISLIIINGNGFNPIVKTPIYINENTIKRFILLWFIAIPIMKAVTETKTVDVIRSGLRGKL